MPLHRLTITFDAHAPAAMAQFWGGMLRRDVIEDAGGALVPGGDTQLDLRFVASPAERVRPNRMHLHLTSASVDDQQHTVEAAVALGGGHLDVGQRPDEEHVVLADPEGNEFCVIEFGNTWLARCGFLGEIACDGTREVGVFWSDALGWPLVWDQDQETAIQSPDGGTKVAWGGPPVAPKVGRNRQRFELAVPGGELRAEVDRLVALGATRLHIGDDGVVEMGDPDGNEFRLTAG